MQIAQPYLLFLGDVTDPLAAKPRVAFTSGDLRFVLAKSA